MKKFSLLLTATCAASAIFFCAGGEGDALFANPPIRIVPDRDGWNLLFIRVDNKSDKHIFCTLEITSRSMPPKMFTVGAMDFRIVGYGILSSDYRAGDCGYIKVEGYSRKLYFELSDSRYRTDFGWFGRWL